MENWQWISINLWHDRWLEDIVIVEKFHHLYFTPTARVSHIIAGNNYNIPHDLPTKVASFLSQTRTIQINAFVPNTIRWSPKPTPLQCFL